MANTTQSATKADIDRLITQLANDRWAERRAAEDGLRKAGPAAVGPLTAALRSDSDRLRWGAAKVLGELRDASAAPALAESLEDEDGGVRWLAAQGLIAIGQPAVVPVLRRLLSRADSPWFQEGAHHVLRGLATPAISPVIHALEARFPEMTAPVAANEALKALE